ncbi:cytochrome b subunit [Alicycliphilus sp. B1]|nr:cytochrome b subunit [Alicycliphilus sp. B1]
MLRGRVWLSSNCRSECGPLGITRLRRATAAKAYLRWHRRGADQHDGLAQQRLQQQLRRVRRIEQDRQVHAPRHQGLAQAHAEPFFHRDRGLREAGQELLHQIRREHVRHPRGQPHRDSAARAALAVQHVGARLLPAREDGSRMREQRLPRGREHHAAPRPVEHALAQLLLQQQNLAAQRRLRHGKRRRGATQAAGLCHCHEVLQAGQVHVPRVLIQMHAFY